MRLPYAVLALALGVIVFLGVEVGGALTGTLTAMTRSAALDASAYALGTLLLALLLAPLLRGRRWRGVLGAALFLLLYAPLVAAIAGALELTVTDAWGVPGLVRSAFIATPVNLVVTFVLELWFVALPLALATVLVLRARARGRRGGPSASPRGRAR